MHTTDRSIQRTRRRLLSMLLGTTALVPLVRYTSAGSARFPAGPDCTVTPAQTEGPFFIDHPMQRSDIRAGREGILLQLGLRVTRVNTNSPPSCLPLPGATVDVWHCDAQGSYSGASPGTEGQRFLRGQQTTDASGVVNFISIFPGWYPGRTPHIHFKIRTPLTPKRTAEFTSQLYFPPEVSALVYREEPYRRRGGRAASNQEDWIYRHGGDQLLMTLTEVKDGFMANYAVGLQGV